MYTEKQARAKMQEYIDYMNNSFFWNYDWKPGIIIYDNLTRVEEFGWIYFWQVQEVREDLSNVISGNGPILIEKETLDMYKMMTGLTVEENIKKYLKCKNDLAKLEKDEDGNFDIINIDN
ncbi:MULTISPECIES: hypothetical protein [Flavobacterium]|uniref:Immunity protein 35 domain-containing protein n=1 Tax=Flavobacterium hankyongi TaxID=1176532 RepID=A0ABP8ZMQ4_9FLAO|nr:hypothetical protein [Flavobacterium sp. N1846]